MKYPRTHVRKSSSQPVYRAKKRFGQNFLKDQYMAQRLVDACAFTGDDIVVEIGPGLGALTRLIAPNVGRLIAIEKDRELSAHLTDEMSGTSAEIICADFLDWDLTALGRSLPRKIRVFGNLPYYISTPIISRILEQRSWIQDFFLTVQLEFGERLVAEPGGKDYSALSCFAQYYALPEMLFKIKKTCFTPVPNVESCFLKMTMRDHPAVNVTDEDLFFRIIRTAFQHRRKTLVNALSSLSDKKILSRVMDICGIAAQERPECLSLGQYAGLTDQLAIEIKNYQ